MCEGGATEIRAPQYITMLHMYNYILHAIILYMHVKLYFNAKAPQYIIILRM